MKAKHSDTDKAKEPATRYVSVEALKLIGETLKTMAGELNRSPKESIGRWTAKGAAFGLKAMGVAGDRLSQFAKEGLTMIELMDRYPDLGMADAVKIGKSYLDGYVKKTSGKVQSVIGKGKAVTDGLTGDAGKFLKELCDGEGAGQQLIERLNETAVRGYEKIISLLRLPSREDLEKISESMDKLNRRVDGLKCKTPGGGHAKN